jgi:hypothetical protein
MGSLALRPGDLLTIPRMALSVGFIRFVSSRMRPKLRGTDFYPDGTYLPLNMSAFHWTHWFAISRSMARLVVSRALMKRRARSHLLRCKLLIAS